jgi:hypothetical protein
MTVFRNKTWITPALVSHHLTLDQKCRFLERRKLKIKNIGFLLNHSIFLANLNSLNLKMHTMYKGILASLLLCIILELRISKLLEMAILKDFDFNIYFFLLYAFLKFH